MRVKDMPRNQQKAVFAKKTDDGYMGALEGAEKYQRRRDYLIRKNELAETYEDKIFHAYNNPKLTHRQRMARIAKIKSEAEKKLSKVKAKEESQTIVGEMREENWRRFKKQYSIKEVPINKKSTWKQIKAKHKKADPQADYDKDGVKNAKDCRPLDKKKHFVGAFAVGVGASFVGSKLAKSREKKND